MLSVWIPFKPAQTGCTQKNTPSRARETNPWVPTWAQNGEGVLRIPTPQSIAQGHHLPQGSCGLILNEQDLGPLRDLGPRRANTCGRRGSVTERSLLVRTDRTLLRRLQVGRRPASQTGSQRRPYLLRTAVEGQRNGVVWYLTVLSFSCSRKPTLKGHRTSTKKKNGTGGTDRNLCAAPQHLRV